MCNVARVAALRSRTASGRPIEPDLHENMSSPLLFLFKATVNISVMSKFLSSY